MEKTLSIFIDESGDFGFKRGSSDYYLLTFVFHEQDKKIDKEINKIKNIPYFHGGALIRREDEYKDYTFEERRKIFVLFSGFVSSLPIKVKTFEWHKKEFELDKHKLEKRMARDINLFILDNFSYFCSFSNIIYYDRGQTFVSRLLNICFSNSHLKFTFKESVKPEYYRLFQVADFFTIVKLFEIKFETNSLSNSEKQFFDKYRFKKIYLKMMKKKEF